MQKEVKNIRMGMCLYTRMGKTDPLKVKIDPLKVEMTIQGNNDYDLWMLTLCRIEYTNGKRKRIHIIFNGTLNIYKIKIGWGFFFPQHQKF